MKDEVRRLIKKAETTLKVAEELIRGGHPPDAASKVYYAMFYAAQAALISEGVDVVKHSAVESAFGLHFAKSGKMDSKFHRMLIDARKIREIADYDTREEIIEPVATLKIEDGKSFLETIKKFLGLIAP